LLALGTWEYGLKCDDAIREGGAGIRALGRTLSCRAAFGSEDLEARSMMEVARRGVFILRLLCWDVGLEAVVFQASSFLYQALEATPDFASAALTTCKARDFLTVACQEHKLS
jgi:hypothetical protein